MVEKKSLLEVDCLNMWMYLEKHNVWTKIMVYNSRLKSIFIRIHTHIHTCVRTHLVYFQYAWFVSAKMFLLFKKGGGVQNETVTWGVELRKWIESSSSDTKLHKMKKKKTLRLSL